MITQDIDFNDPVRATELSPSKHKLALILGKGTLLVCHRLSEAEGWRPSQQLDIGEAFEPRVSPGARLCSICFAQEGSDSDSVTHHLG